VQKHTERLGTSTFIGSTSVERNTGSFAFFRRAASAYQRAPAACRSAMVMAWKRPACFTASVKAGRQCCHGEKCRPAGRPGEGGAIVDAPTTTASS